MQTYLVGRQNTRQPCDIELPEEETSVSRKHLELSVTDEGEIYIVHLHPQNVTSVYRDARWQNVTQDFVSPDERLTLGAYRTTARELLLRVQGGEPAPQPAPRQPAPPEPTPGTGGSGIEWDPDQGTFRRPRR